MAEPYRSETAPPSDRCSALKLLPTAWKVRKWRAFDGSVQPMVRLETPIRPIDLFGDPIHDLFARFEAPLAAFQLYLEEAAAAPLPLSWSVGRITLAHDRCWGWLHHFLADDIGRLMATLLGGQGVASDIVLSVIPFQNDADKVELAVRDYDLGLGGRLGR